MLSNELLEKTLQSMSILFSVKMQVFLLALYLLITTIISDVVSLSDKVSCILVLIMAIVLMSPLAIPVKMTIFPAKQ
jgi:hypothetical protein